jgi:predicted O-methyltransferase YrrM
VKELPRYMLPPLQEPREFDAFIKILKDEKVKSYLEIGSMYGASLWKVATQLPKGSLIVSIDPMTDRHEARESLQGCISELIKKGYDAHWIFGDSMDWETVAIARKYSPFDALFIDGNHTPEYVMSDWIKYGPMARIVAFHDINWNSTWLSKKDGKPVPEHLMGAPKIWEQIKNGHRFREFKLHPPQNYYGIGVLWN